MNSSQSKIYTLCEKQAKECNIDNSTPNNASVCSCSQCNSFDCFAQRNKEQCLCYQGCKAKPFLETNTNLPNTSQSKSSVKSVNLLETGNIPRECVKKDFFYECKNNDNLTTIKKLARYSYNCVPEYSNRDNVDDNRVDISTERLPHSRSAYMTYSHQNFDTNTAKISAANIKYSSQTFDTNTAKLSAANIKCSHQNFETNTGKLSAANIKYSSQTFDTNTAKLSATNIKYSTQTFDTNTAKLSAQIMNVPYRDFKESISYNKSEDAAPKPTILSRYDILKRIKEAYRACSCKVCECLIGQTSTCRGQRDLCKCKPCECNECLSLMKTIDNKEKNIEMCLGCPKKGLKPYCNPCDCLKCSDSFTTPCNCQPCECIECKSYSISLPRRNNTLVVASIREDTPRAYCSCSPCGCAECGQDYTMGSSLRHEIGTGINRPVNCSCDACMNQACEMQDSISCTCDTQNRLMRKPVEKDIRDYDIHRALVKKNVAERSQNKNDTIAMFAAVENRFRKYDIKKNSCSCGDCECIVCSCKENTTTSINNKPYKYREIDACKCSACECLLCNSSTVKDDDFLDRKNVCKCNICDCLKCDGLSKPSTSNDERNLNSNKFKSTIPSNACKCSPCECTDCQKMMYKCNGDSCYCTNCECQMCTDQTMFINETVFRDRNEYLPLSFTHGNNNCAKYFPIKNYDKIGLRPKSLHPDSARNIQMNSRQNLVIYNESPNVDNPIRKSTQVLISNNPEFKDQIRHQTVPASEAFTKCKEKKIVESYCRAHEYESSRSFLSESSSLGLPSRVSNIQPNENLKSVKEQERPKKSAFEFEKSCDTSNHNSLLIKFPVKTGLNDFTNFSSDSKDYYQYENACNPIGSLYGKTQTNLKMNYTKSDVNVYPSIDGTNSERNELLEVDEYSYSIEPIRKTCTGFSKNRDLAGQDHKTIHVKDLTLNLVTALKNANDRLSTLMEPELSNNRFKLGPSKADISLPRKTSSKETVRTKNNENNIEMNPLLQNSSPKYIGHLSEMEIDYEKVSRILHQAKVFSLELAKVLKDYKKANEKLESKYLKETQSNISSNTLLDIYRKYKTNSVGTDKPIKNNLLCGNLVEGLDQKPYSSAYEPEKKYGSHNLSIVTTKQDIPETDDHQLAKIDYSIKILPENESDTVSYDLDVDINKNTNITTRQDTEKQDSKLSHDKVLINRPSSSIDKQVEQELDEHFEPRSNSSCNQRNEDRHKCRSDKTQKCTKGGKRPRVPKSVILYKRLKLKEALMHLATHSGSRQDDVTPKGIQCDTKEKVIINDETTQHEPHFSEVNRETTSTATDAMGRHETSRFVQPVQVGIVPMILTE